MISARRPGLRTACDRCYELKERCVRSATGPCSRCSRLQQACRTIRPIKVSGRRPRRELGAVSRNGAGSLNDTSWLKDIDLQPEEQELLEFLLNWPDSHKYCVIGPDLDAAGKTSIAALLVTAWPLLKDGLFAHASVFMPSQKGGMDENYDLNIRRACSAMKILRELSVASVEDAALCLTLGQMLASFVYSVIGKGVSDICNHCLSLTRPFIDTPTLGPETQPQLTFLVLMETMECIVHRQKPTLRFSPCPEYKPDRYLGLCLPLMPYYHDLCVISSAIGSATDPNVVASLQQQLEDVLGFVKEWQPSAPDQLVRQHSSAEVVHLLTQAKVYRLAAMLIAHRLRYVFGKEDAQGDLLSQEILMELRVAKEMTGTTSGFVTMPFIVAAVEVRNSTSRVRAIQDVDIYVDQFTPVIRRTTKIFLARVWRDRDLQANHSWFDSVVKPCAVLNSISRTVGGQAAT